MIVFNAKVQQISRIAQETLKALEAHGISNRPSLRDYHGITITSKSRGNLNGDYILVDSNYFKGITVLDYYAKEEKRRRPGKSDHRHVMRIQIDSKNTIISTYCRQELPGFERVQLPDDEPLRNIKSTLQTAEIKGTSISGLKKKLEVLAALN